MKLDPKLEQELDATGLPWHTEVGGKHYKIKLAGRLVGVYPKGKVAGPYKRSLLNTITQVRRAAQEIMAQ
jgi:hypothetical protein